MASSPPERDAEPEGGDKRARILRAAQQVGRERGVTAARMEEVAALARVSKGTLYRFFRSKEDLFLATLLASYEEGLRILDTASPPVSDPRRRLDAMLDGLLRVLESVAPGMSLHFQAFGVVANDPVFEERLNGFLRAFHAERDAEVLELLREGQERGVFRPDLDAPAFAQAINALLSGFLYRATFDPERAGPDALRACFDALVRDAVGVGARREDADD